MLVALCAGAVADVVQVAGRNPPDLAGPDPLVHEVAAAAARLDQLAVDDHEGAVGVAMVVEADVLAGGPPEQPHLVGRGGEQTDAGPLVGIVGRRAAARAIRRGRGQ